MRCFRVKLQAAVDNRKSFDLSDKFVVFRSGPPDPAAPKTIRFDFDPKPEPDGRVPTAAACSIDRPVLDSIKLLGLRVGQDPVSGLLGTGRRLASSLWGATTSAPPDFQVGWILWGWTVYLRGILEYAVAVTPEPTPAQAASLESIQRRVLSAFTARGSRRGTAYYYPALLELFGMSEMRTRRRMARLNLLTQLRILCRRRIATATWRRSRLTDPRDQPAAAALVLAFYEYFARLGRGAAGTGGVTPEEQFWHTSRLAQLLRDWDEFRRLPDADRYFQDDEEQGDGIDPLDDPLTDWPWSRISKRRVSHVRQVLKAEARRERRDELRRSRVGQMIVAFAPTDRWRRWILLRLPAGPDTSAYLALLTGTFWPCPLARDAERGFNRSRYCECGAYSNAVDVHFLLRIGPRCSVGTDAVAEWRTRVARAFRAYGCDRALRAARSLAPRARAAIMLGTPRLLSPIIARHIPGVRSGSGCLPVGLQRDLAFAFIRTTGRWSTQYRLANP